VRVLTIGNMYPPHSLGGYELAWRSAVAYLRAAGHDVRVLTTDFRLSEPGPTEDDDPDVHRELRWYWHDHDFPRLRVRERIALERHNATILDRHLREFAPDVVNWWAMGGMSLSLIERVRRAGIRAVGAVADDWLVNGLDVDAWSRMFKGRRFAGAVVDRLFGIPTRPQFGAAGSWVFISETLRAATRNEGIELCDTEVRHLGVDQALFPRAPAKAVWDWRLLYAGRIDPRKGIDIAIRALLHLPETASLTIDGRGDAAATERLQALARDLDLQDRVRFTRSSRRELATAYAEADVVVFPVQWAEPFGLVPLEAMAVGTPVVATGTGGSGEYLRDEENCLLFAPHDSADALAATVIRLAGSAGLRDALRDGGFDTAARSPEYAFNERIEIELTR